MNEQNIPIDIHVGKLLEWLTSRHIVGKNWHTKITEIRNRIAHAINDMPSHDHLVKLLSGTHIHYFHCLQIIDILKTTEADTKSVFGSYGSQRMKDWQEIVRLYERDCIYLGEAAQILVRNINYELPAVKKQIVKIDQLIDEANKKIQDQTASESVLISQRTATCQKLGIKGENLSEEFLEKIQEIPKLNAEIASITSKLCNAVELYGKASENPECLQLLRHVITKGNTTVYEYVNGEQPLSIEEPTVRINLSDIHNANINENNNDNEIDFGDVEIDFGDINNANDVVLDGGEIDWGIEESIGEEIDFNISLQDSGITVEGSGMSGGVARNGDALTVLDSPSYREQFLDELFELEAFLKMRLYELKALENSNTVSFMLSDGMDDHTAQSISALLKDVENVLNKATDELHQHLHQLKHSEKYADILAGKLQQKLAAVEKIQITRKLLKEKIEQLKSQKENIQPLVGKITEHTKSLQDNIEADISKRYKNRPVNIIGGLSFF